MKSTRVHIPSTGQTLSWPAQNQTISLPAPGATVKPSMKLEWPTRLRSPYRPIRLPKER